MRILSLRFKNINSLRGEWKIDFSAPPFCDSGLFAITGATGAEKPPCWTPSAWRCTTRPHVWTPSPPAKMS
ncbi:hypothetical protein MAY76_02500 [Edwardsiella ictaluri]|nr:hypothetical protein [Edwardsiella ictaluri]WFO10327.1 hypothetical protein MAY76_02500 [Edwardsiella ictaluri]